MNWKLFTRSPRSRKNQSAAQRARFQPKLDLLEDRTLLALAVFAIDPGVSRLNLSGDVGGAAIQEQGTGSLSTTYEGQADVDMDLDAATISFLSDGASGVIADNSGNWQPAVGGGTGSAPANYGGRVSFLGTGLAAVRDLVANATADSLPLTPDGSGGYAFPSSQTLTILQGAADYTHPIGGHGRADLSNQSAPNSAGPGNLQDNGDGTFTLTAPIDLTLIATISGVTAHLRISGTISGTGGFAGARPGGSGRTIDAAAALAPGSGGSATAGALFSSDVTRLGDVGSTRLQTGEADTGITPVQVQEVGTNGLISSVLQSTSAASSAHRLAIDTLAIEMVRNEA